jgi:hypothetical protein
MCCARVAIPGVPQALEEHEDPNHPVVALATRRIEELSARRSSVEEAIQGSRGAGPTAPGPTRSRPCSRPCPTSGQA